MPRSTPSFLFGAFLRDRRGNVLVTSAILMPVLIGVAALVAEYGGALLERTENQRAADIASFAGAIAYAATKSTQQMEGAAANLAALNGLEPSDLDVALVPSVKTAGVQAVAVDVTTTKPLLLSRVLDSRMNLQIAADAATEVGAAPPTPGCILALSPSASGITLSGGTKIQAPDCTVSSNNTVTVPCGTEIRSIGVNYNSASAPSHPCTGIKNEKGGAAVIAKTQSDDPLAGNAAIKAASDRFTETAFTGLLAPAAPSVVAGRDIEFAWDQNATKAAATQIGCTATWSQPTWKLTCPGRKSLNFGRLSVGGGINLEFAVDGNSTVIAPGQPVDPDNANTVTFNFSGPVVLAGGGTMTFGPGIYNMSKGLHNSGGTKVTFGRGLFRIGQSDSTCGSGRFSLCNSETLSFDGPSTFQLTAGLRTSSDKQVTLGAGTGNSYHFGPSTNGFAIEVDGGGKLLMADATETNSRFRMAGNIKTSGGSCLALPMASHHDVKGSLEAGGGVKLGAGQYNFDGFFALGSNHGGQVNCWNQTISLHAVDVTLVLSGKTTPTSWNCKDNAFCVAAGYSNIKLLAPATGTNARLALIGPQDAARRAGAAFTEGGSNAEISGAFYFPHGPITMNGGASTMGPKGDKTRCLQLIGTYITLAGGTAMASECIGPPASGGSGKVSLVQ